MIRVLIALAVCVPALAQASYAERPEVEAFVRELARRHGLEENELKRVFARAQRLNPVLEAIARPAERVRTWEEYRALLITERRIAEGVEFARQRKLEFDLSQLLLLAATAGLAVGALGTDDPVEEAYRLLHRLGVRERVPN